MRIRFFIPGRGRIPRQQGAGSRSCAGRPGAADGFRCVGDGAPTYDSDRGRIPLLQGAKETRAVTAPPRNLPPSQRGSALFVAIFLIAVVAVLAAAVALTSVTQQLGAARALQAEQAWYAAFGRIEIEAPGMLAGDACPGGGAQDIAGFTTTFECTRTGNIEEGGETYSVFSVSATAQRGNAASGSLVRRTARAQFTNLN